MSAQQTRRPRAHSLQACIIFPTFPLWGIAGRGSRAELAATRTPAALRSSARAGGRGVKHRQTVCELFPIVLPSPLVGEGAHSAAQQRACGRKGGDTQTMPRTLGVRPTRNTRARQLRRTMTEAERKLWWLLRRKQLAGFRFRRQAPIGPYIADLFCAEAKLIIELRRRSAHGRRAFLPRCRAHALARSAWLPRHPLLEHRPLRTPLRRHRSDLPGPHASDSSGLTTGPFSYLPPLWGIEGRASPAELSRPERHSLQACIVFLAFPPPWEGARRAAKQRTCGRKGGETPTNADKCTRSLDAHQMRSFPS